MPKFNNGKITSSVIFYNRGVPNAESNFGRLTTINYAMIRQMARHNVQQGRPIFYFM